MRSWIPARARAETGVVAVPPPSVILKIASYGPSCRRGPEQSPTLPGVTTPCLWSWNLSPFAGKVRVAFAEKGVAIELIEIDPLQRPAKLRELNPTNRVPVLELDGTAVRESTAICEWLEDTHPAPPLWPADPAARATARVGR